MMDTESQPSEYSPLLSTTKVLDNVKPTPLPRLAMFNIMLLQLVEPLTALCIYPFVTSIVLDSGITGGDEKKIGHYAGIIESSFYVTEAIFVLHWGVLSDRIGRKPVLLLGLGGLCVPMIFFGLSKSFSSFVICRCIIGMMNGNIGVIKSLVGDVTDSTNMTDAFSLLTAAWATGAVLGPFIGGLLCDPQKKWPNTFSAEFWANCPYFLPCACAALFSALVFVFTLIFMKEPSYLRVDDKRSLHSDDSSITYHEEIDVPSQARGKLILSKPLVYSVASYGIISFLEAAFSAIRPVFYATSPHSGGLGFSSEKIGAILSCYALFNGAFQAFVAPSFVKAAGCKRVYMFALLAFVPISVLCPLLNMLVRHEECRLIMWTAMVVKFCFNMIVDTGFSCVFLFLASSSPNQHSLGAVYGLGQVSASIFRAIGPAPATSMFALSIQSNVLGGYSVFVILGLLSCGAACTINQVLPDRLWVNGKEDNDED